MYEVKFWWSTRAGDRYTAYLHMMKTAIGKRSAFAVVACMDDHTHVDEVEIPDYPIWAEPVLALTARGLQAGGFRASKYVYAGPLLDWSQPENQATSIDVSVSLLPFGPGTPRELEGVFITVESDRISCRHRKPNFIGDLMILPPPPAQTDAWAIVFNVLCNLLWGTPTLGPMPSVLKVPVHRWANQTYIRVDDIPLHPRKEFAHYLEFIDKPDFTLDEPGKCAYALDWENFHTGKVYYEAGFIPGLYLQVAF